ncbi:ricin-type beta-trefoil lectin domain protein [Streptomyces aidingensis]|uniref:Ricin-type beta-trefoil lectin domain-containing protein n=1 Tax=Streptomyces aidingensis TaxID=910347 RepID=A0A1I1Q4L9_9ACTN|nr:ricin-type beta-trefoil lectin domain protein [Streptomyces aidingensis]SFD17071.1 Ricin-type beta-trefoil lectin domain-containing protein [Streptomyces aidingensis]
MARPHPPSLPYPLPVSRPLPRRITPAVLPLTLALCAALAALLLPATPTHASTPSAPATAATPLPADLPADLEARRAAEATALYGDPGVRPLAERPVSLVSLGDSQISGEGAGNYEPPTDGPDNWCHRSADAAIHRTGIPADVTYNFACSGASTENVRIGGTPQYADELVQSDSLAIAARNTRVDTILMFIGANDDLQFGPVMTDCVVSWFLFWQGPCHPEYAPTWQDRVDGLRPKVEATITDLHTVMAEAGYAPGSYDLVVASYPGPIGPDIHDNPDFPGKIPGGCTGYDSDAAWGRDQAVPAFETGIRAAALAAGATYLDLSRLFHGHEVCMADPWVRGLWIELLNPFPPDENTVRQSFHPNAKGHAAFAACLTQLHALAFTPAEASCAAPAGTSDPLLHLHAWDDVFTPLTNTATTQCAAIAATRNGTEATGTPCTGARAQQWWHDPATGALHTALSHDRCLDIPGGDYGAGTALTVWDCHGGDNQRFTRSASGTLAPAAAPDLCVTQSGPGARLTLQPCTGSPGQRFT